MKRAHKWKLYAKYYRHTHWDHRLVTMKKIKAIVTGWVKLTTHDGELWMMLRQPFVGTLMPTINESKYPALSIKLTKPDYTKLTVLLNDAETADEDN